MKKTVDATRYLIEIRKRTEGPCAEITRRQEAQLEEDKKSLARERARFERNRRMGKSVANKESSDVDRWKDGDYLKRLREELGSQLAAAIKQGMKALGITRAELCRRTGLNDVSIKQMIERERYKNSKARCPRLETIVSIMRELGYELVIR